MPWSKMAEVPVNLRRLRGVPLTLAQANWIARCADGLVSEGTPRSTAWAICVDSFKKQHVVRKGAWVKR